MALASPVFKAMLQNDFREGYELRSTGRVEMSLPEDNPALLEILLNIIHGRSKLVPAGLCLEQLQDLSLLVDKYGCSNIVQVYAQAWFAQVEATAPEEPGPMFIVWLNMAWVFKLRPLFKQLTKIAILASCGKLQMPSQANFHLPDRVLGECC